ncbi:MAG: tetratricopeptide repeat protein [Pyrinomonadaceae bacterium]
MMKSIEKQAMVYRFGQFEINAGEQLLRREGEIVPLTPKIFEMLLLLVRNNNRMLSKDVIMETVWADSFVEETNLTSNISRLRKILHAGGERFIETFPKRGYRFRGEVETIDAEIVLNRRVTTRVRQIVEEFDDTDELPEYAAALETLPNNLTLPITPIVGREKQINEIENLLRRNRLVTLTGIGGTGKTRLAQEIACRLLSEFPDGVFFIPLAAVRNAELVASEIAQTLGVKESGGKSLIDATKDFLREKNMLLAVDNFEQIVAAAPVLSELLAAAPDLKMLATSRVLLHLKAEREFIVPPLALPDLSEPSAIAGGLNFTIEILSENESVKLFTERARAIKSNFSLTEDNAAIVAEICYNLDGLPLAIELAAARIKILSPEQILTRLENRLKLLTGGAKDLPARQQTMRGAIEWSYDLLDKAEQILFRRTAVFAGGFTIEAVEAIEAICGNDESQDKVQSPKSKVQSPKTKDQKPKPEIDVLNCLTSLVENSLVFQTETANGESRFRLLEVVREYALETLEASGECEMRRKNHAVFFLELTRKADPEIFGEQGGNWLNRLEDEHDNLRAALAWSTVNDIETAANLAGALRNFWILHNHLTEGRKWLETILEYSDESSAAVRFKLLNGLGHTAGYQGDLETARRTHEKGLAEGKAANDWRQAAISMRGLGFVAKWKNDLAAARKFYEESLAVSRELDDQNGIAVSLTSLGDLARMKNDFAAARPFYEESLMICQRTGNEQGVVGSLNNLGAVAFGEGDFQAAHSYYAEAMAAVLRLGEKISLSYSLDGFAALAVKRGAVELAAQLAGAAEHLRESLGFDTEPAERLFREAYLVELYSAIDKKDLTEAREQGRKLKIEKAVELALKVGKQH